MNVKSTLDFNSFIVEYIFDFDRVEEEHLVKTVAFYSQIYLSSIKLNNQVIVLNKIVTL